MPSKKTPTKSEKAKNRVPAPTTKKFHTFRFETLGDSLTHKNAHKYIPMLIDQLREYVKDPQSIMLEAFLDQKDLSYDDWYSWCDTYPELKRATDMAVQAIGTRRETLAAYNNMNTSVFLRVQGHYHKRWRIEQKREADLKKHEDAQGGIVVVRMKDAPEGVESIDVEIEKLTSTE